jgi:hypothetical protein
MRRPHGVLDVSGDSGVEYDRRLAPDIRGRLAAYPGAAEVEHTVWPAHFACPNLVLRGADGVNRGISDALSPWSAAAAEPGTEV